MLSLPHTALALSIALSLAYTAFVMRPPSLMRTIAKTGATAFLAVFALVTGGPALLVIALLLSAAGDAFLSREGQSAFLYGLASFLLAHIVFIVLFVAVGDARLFAEPWRIAAAAVLTLVSLAFVALLLRSVPSALHLPVALYTFAILVMGVTALATDRPPVIIGAILFMASDMLLAGERFMAPPEGSRSLARQAVWTIYYAAQLLITIGFVA